MKTGAERLGDCIKSREAQVINSVASGFCYGTVLTLDPLTVQLETGGSPLTEHFLLLSPFCYDYDINIKSKFTTEPSLEGVESEPTGDLEHTHDVEYIQKIRLWRGLREGDTVTMSYSSDKQKYLIEYYDKLEVGDVDEEFANIPAKPTP